MAWRAAIARSDNPRDEHIGDRQPDHAVERHVLAGDDTFCSEDLCLDPFGVAEDWCARWSQRVAPKFAFILRSPISDALW